MDHEKISRGQFFGQVKRDLEQEHVDSDRKSCQRGVKKMHLSSEPEACQAYKSKSFNQSA